jgi:predicted nucleic acid-binding protein
VIVCDAGPLVAAALANDADHAACVRLFTGLHVAGTQLLVPATVAAEVGYLLAREAGPWVESLFLRSLADGGFSAIDLTAADYARMADLVTTYGSLPLGTTDASVIALAERFRLAEVATLDRRQGAVAAGRRYQFKVWHHR